MISVVVAAFNYANFLPEALDSLIAQTRRDWECLVVDDGSTDATFDVACSYAARDSRVIPMRQENRGPSAARNLALRQARGEYVQFLDADDRLAATKLETHAAYLDSHADVDVVYGPVSFFRTELPDEILHSLDGRLSRPLMAEVSGTKDALRKLQMFNVMPILAPLLRRGVFDRAGLFNEAVRGNEDWDLWLRAAIAGCTFQFVPASTSLAFIRTHPRSASRSADRMVRGLIEASRSFSSPHWSGPGLPLVYEMAAGIDAVEQGGRGEGARRIAAAARGATSMLVRLRWSAYAAGAWVLPSTGFSWLVRQPMPEWGLEVFRKISARG
ncbi:MAG: glycosyltransferase family 2 protein [Thermoanaerobaculia bacterium]